MMIRRWSLLLTVLIGFALVSAACAGGDDDKAEPTVTRVPVTMPATDPTVSTQLAPDEVTAGEIADLIAAAWPTVTMYTSVTEILSVPSGSPVASPQPENIPRAERNVVMPDSKRIAITDLGKTTEIVLMGGVISKREIGPDGTPGPWETIDPDTVPASDPFARTYQSIQEPEQPPYSGLSQRQRERVGTRIGETEINGKTCLSYSFPEVAENGEQITIVVSLSADNLPCRIETTTADSISRTDYWFNEPVTFATPVASPVAATDQRRQYQAAAV